MKLASCKSALNPTVVYSTDRSKAVVPVLVLHIFRFVVYSTRRFVVCLSVCHFVLVCWYCSCLAWGRGGGGSGGGGGWSWCFSCVCSICACLGLSVSSSSWGLGRAAVCDCGTPWTFLLPPLFLERFVFNNKQTIKVSNLYLIEHLINI